MMMGQEEESREKLTREAFCLKDKLGTQLAATMNVVK